MYVYISSIGLLCMKNGSSDLHLKRFIYTENPKVSRNAEQVQTNNNKITHRSVNLPFQTA